MPPSITTFVKVRAALNKAPSQHTPLFISLVNNGKNHPHSCQHTARLAFGLDESDFPALGKMISPFYSSKLPSLEGLQGLLIDDLQAERRSTGDKDNSTHQSTKYAKGDEPDEELTLLNSITNGTQMTSGLVLGFPSPSLDDICGDTKVEYENVLRESITMATVLSAETILALQHSNEGTTFTTLLSGSAAWIIWPPTTHNLDILQNSYEVFSEGLDSIKTDVCNQLQGGVCLVQSPRETIRIPSFCPMVCLPLETSILATYSVVTANQLATMLGKLPLLLAWFKTEVDGERKKREFVTALLPHLSTILQGSFEKHDLKKCRYPYSEEGPLHSLLYSWDGIKHAVAGTLNTSEAEQVIVMWDAFLRQARGRQCWLCGKDIRNRLREIRKHFETEHWVTEKSAENAEPQSQPQEDPEGGAELSADREATSEDTFHDVMEEVEPQGELRTVRDGVDVAVPSIMETMEDVVTDGVVDTSE